MIFEPQETCRSNVDGTPVSETQRLQDAGGTTHQSTHSIEQYCSNNGVSTSIFHNFNDIIFRIHREGEGSDTLKIVSTLDGFHNADLNLLDS